MQHISSITPFHQTAEATMYAIKVLSIVASLFSALNAACPIVERAVAEAGNAAKSCPKYDYSQQGRDWPSKCAGMQCNHDCSSVRQCTDFILSLVKVWEREAAKPYKPTK